MECGRPRDASIPRPINVELAKKCEARGWRGKRPCDQLDYDMIMEYLDDGFVDAAQAEESAMARAMAFGLYHIPEPGPDGWYDGMRRPDPTTGRLPLPVAIPIDGQPATLELLHALLSVEKARAWDIRRKRGNTL